MLDGLGAARVDGAVPPDLAAQLATCPPFHLVIDDVEVLTQPRSLALVSQVIDDAPEGSEVLLASRSESAVPLARLRAAGAVVDVGADDLALDAAETRELLATAGLELSDEQVDDIRERTEGWAAGIALAMLSQAEHDDLPAGLIGRSPDVARYLLEEAVERQSADVKHFLLASSVLQYMSPAVCNAALEITDSSEILAEIEHASLFTASLGSEGEWRRYHHLFRELLQQELRRQAPDVIPGVLRRASAWHEANDDPDEAFAYAHAAEDLCGAGEGVPARCTGPHRPRTDRDASRLARAVHAGGAGGRCTAGHRRRVGRPAARRRGRG